MLAELLGIRVELVYKAARPHRLPMLPRLCGLRFDGVEVARSLFDSPGQKTRQVQRSCPPSRRPAKIPNRSSQDERGFQR